MGKQLIVKSNAAFAEASLTEGKAIKVSFSTDVTYDALITKCTETEITYIFVDHGRTTYNTVTVANVIGGMPKVRLLSGIKGVLLLERFIDPKLVTGDAIRIKYKGKECKTIARQVNNEGFYAEIPYYGQTRVPFSEVESGACEVEVLY